MMVTDRDHEVVTAQYLNTDHPQRLQRFRLCWQHQTKPEVQSNYKPKAHGYEAWTDEFLLAELCQCEVQLNKIGNTTNGNWYNLSKKDADHALKFPPL